MSASLPSASTVSSGFGARPRLLVSSLVGALAALLIAVLLLPGPAEARETSQRQKAAYAQIEGTGSTWSDLVVQQWIADVSSNGMKVVYTGGGSSKGRKDFAQGSTDFAISEIPYQGTDETGQADSANGRDFAYLPIVAGGTAFTYQLKIGNTQVRNLRLSGETLTKIFTNQITNWNDPAIAGDNNGRKFPSLPITPVVRSDGSGTTAQFTAWMDKTYPSLWRAYFGKSGLTSYYPRKGRAVGQAGSDQVMNTIAGFAGNGTIGYVEYAYPMDKDYPVVKVLNKAGYYVEPTQYNVAVALTKARINQDKNSEAYLTQILDGVYGNTDPRAYPISSYSYLIIPTGAGDTRMTTAKRQTLGDFMYYSLCAGQSKAGPYGYSPLPLNLVKAGFEQVNKLKKADPAVDLAGRDVTQCNNPTFVAGDLSKNKLAEIAPQPAACDKVGAGPCGIGTGTGEPSTDAGTKGPGDKAGAGGAKEPTGSGGAGDPSGAGGSGDGKGGAEGKTPVVDPATGQTVLAAGANPDVMATPTELVAERAGDTTRFGWAAGALLLALVLVPGLLGAALRRSRTSTNQTSARRQQGVQ